MYFCLPEMKGHSLEMIDEMFAKRVPVHNFRTYHGTFADMAACESQKKIDGGMTVRKTDLSHVEEAEIADLEGQLKK